MGIEVHIEGPFTEDLNLRVRLYRGKELLVDDRYGLQSRELSRAIRLPDPGIDDAREDWLWSPEHPRLLEAELELRSGERLLDRVKSYTALRSVGVEGNHFLLNGRPYYLRMVLDQGYWPDTFMAATDEALRRDVALTKALGFNNVRKHQKLEDPRYFYWCDRLGLLAWVEMPSAYRFNPEVIARLTAEWIEALFLYYSHPSVVAWVPFNESWGVPDLPKSPAQRDYVRALYHLTKALDPTRLVVDNDG